MFTSLNLIARAKLFTDFVFHVAIFLHTFCLGIMQHMETDKFYNDQCTSEESLRLEIAGYIRNLNWTAGTLQSTLCIRLLANEKKTKTERSTITHFFMDIFKSCLI